jgi:hypothetical protein
MSEVEAKKQFQREVDLEGELPEVVHPTKTVRVSQHYRHPPTRPMPSTPSEPIEE